jgi:hypothetical protein
MKFLPKFGLSAVVALAAIGGWLYMKQLGLSGPQWAMTFLGPFTVFSLWIFPDVMRNRADGRTPRHQGEGGRS